MPAYVTNTNSQSSDISIDHRNINHPIRWYSIIAKLCSEISAVTGSHSFVPCTPSKCPHQPKLYVYYKLI
jgi:hypothetical protein